MQNDFKEVSALLLNYGAIIEPDKHQPGAYIVEFSFMEAVTTLRIVLNDHSGADVVISNMTTLPERKKGYGFGSKALQFLLSWARDNNLHNIRAVQVQSPSESFWIKNGFSRCEEPNVCNDFVCHGSPETTTKNRTSS